MRSVASNFKGNKVYFLVKRVINCYLLSGQVIIIRNVEVGYVTVKVASAESRVLAVSITVYLPAFRPCAMVNDAAIICPFTMLHEVADIKPSGLLENEAELQ